MITFEFMLSIIIPALNEEKYLSLLLDSIKKQLRVDYEIIVADAGSRDKTVEIAAAYGCRVVKGGLPAKARNEGAGAASGDLLFFVDADNGLPDYFFEKVLREFAARDLDAGSFMLTFTEGNKLMGAIFSFVYNSWLGLFSKIRPFGAANILVKRELHRQIDGFDEAIKVGEDVDYIRRAARAGKYGLLKSAKILFPMRRWKKLGYARTSLEYALHGFYMLFFRPPKSNIFKYPFDIYGKNRDR